ncbi:MAG: rubredoxin-NAD+ reductase [Methylophagaceae bacterium]|jgi:rubredoxin-NAD+ reductase
MHPIIIIGSGFAGYTLAREFRKLDSTSPLIIITSDDGRSYPKPMLSNALSKGKSADQLSLSSAKTMAEILNATVINNSIVSQIDPQQHTVTLANAAPLYYQHLVLALGATPIRNAIKGNAANDVLSINNLNDYSMFRQRLVNAKHVAIIGPGLIGCEFANDLINADIAVSVIGPSKLPMDGLLPEPIAAELKTSLSQAGVDWYFESTITAVNHATKGYQLTLANGDLLHADIVISAIGLRPDIELANAMGIAVNRGIVTDEFLQTSQPNIYALGDCAEVTGHNLLFIAPILAAAKALAKTLSGQTTAVKYPAMPVAIKTPNYPLIVSAPAAMATGSWQFESSPSGFGIKGLFTNENNALLGFVLSGDMVSEKQVLTKLLPDILA